MGKAASQPERFRLWLEFIGLYLLIPTLMVAVLPHWSVLPMLLIVTVVVIFLLHKTNDFQWQQLRRGRWLEDPVFTALFAALTLVISILLVHYLLPGQLLAMPIRHTVLWLLIVLLYPFLSALPQELFFRVLFVARYQILFPNRKVLIIANAVCFGMAHVFYENWTAPLLSMAGGLIFAWVYIYRRSFAYTVLLHAIAGVIIFTSGLGVFFYHGAIGRV